MKAIRSILIRCILQFAKYEFKEDFVLPRPVLASKDARGRPGETLILDPGISDQGIW